MKKILTIIIIAGFTYSCVPPTKFNALQSDALTCEEEREALLAENEQLTIDLRETSSKLEMADNKLAQAEKDTLKWKSEVNRLNNQTRQLNNDLSDLQEAQQALLKGSEDEIRRLMDDLYAAQNDLQTRENELNQLADNLSSREQELGKVQTELQNRNSRLTELENMLNEQQAVITTLKNKVSDALLGFKDEGLSVTQKNGRVYVSLEEKLLFKSGSTEVDPKGVSALRSLARILEQNKDIDIMIEGHTDDVPVRSGSAYTDNWDLSVLRATSIVRILLNGSAIDPQRITTAGRSQYRPVDNAKTVEARQKNRRTEIILSPKLDALYELVNE